MKPINYFAAIIQDIPHGSHTENRACVQKLKSVSAYCTLALTNVDHKIYMKVLARRLQELKQDIMGPRQMWGINRRSIALNIHKARSVLDFSDESDEEVAILQIDIEKALDCVEHQIFFALVNHVIVGCVICEGVPWRSETARRG